MKLILVEFVDAGVILSLTLPLNTSVENVASSLLPPCKTVPNWDILDELPSCIICTSVVWYTPDVESDNVIVYFPPLEDDTVNVSKFVIEVDVVVIVPLSNPEASWNVSVPLPLVVSTCPLVPSEVG